MSNDTTTDEGGFEPPTFQLLENIVFVVPAGSGIKDNFRHVFCRAVKLMH